MPNEVQNYLATAAENAVPALIEAYRRLPEDKRNWQPSATARSAQDQLIECALLAGYTAELIQTHHFPESQLETYMADEAKCLELSFEELEAMLKGNWKRC